MDSSVYINDEKQDVSIRPVYSGGCLYVWNLVDIPGQQINEYGPHFRLNLSQDDFLKYFTPSGIKYSIERDQGHYLGQIDETSGRLAAEGIGGEHIISAINYCATAHDDYVFIEISGIANSVLNDKSSAFKINFAVTKANIGSLFLGDEQTENKFEAIING